MKTNARKHKLVSAHFFRNISNKVKIEDAKKMLILGHSIEILSNQSETEHRSLIFHTIWNIVFE